MQRPAKFTQTALQRAIRAATKAGLEVSRVEVEPTGKLVLITKGPTDHDKEAETALDNWLAKNARAPQGAK